MPSKAGHESTKDTKKSTTTDNTERTDVRSLRRTPEAGLRRNPCRPATKRPTDHGSSGFPFLRWCDSVLSVSFPPRNPWWRFLWVLLSRSHALARFRVGNRLEIQVDR